MSPSNPAAPDPVPEFPSVQEDTLLGGRVRLLQPRKGYRAAIDPIFLAAGVDARPGARILDAGAGTGAAALALAVRRPDLIITGLERNTDALALFRASIPLNDCTDRISTLEEDLANAPHMGLAPFDVVMTNPPYTASDSSSSPHPHRSEAHTESGDMPLERWIGCCLALLRPKGRLHVIFPAERTDALVAAARRQTGDVRLFPLWPRAGEPASRVLFSARKGVRGPAQILPGLVLHQTDGTWTPEAGQILRDAAGLDLRPAGRL